MNYGPINGESALGDTPPGGQCRGRSFRDYVVDFYCHKAALVVEVDGDIHDLQQEEDARREKVLSEMGLRVVRFGNDEVMRDLSVVLGKIKELVLVYSATR